MAGKKRGGFGRLMTLLVGAAIGAVGGLLLAPRSGKETREQLKERMEELRSEGIEQYDIGRSRLRAVTMERGQELKGRIEDARERLITGVESVSEKVKERIETGAEKAEEALKEGPAPTPPAAEEPAPEVEVEKPPVEAAAEEAKAEEAEEEKK